MTKEEQVRRSFIEQGKICGALGSSFMEHLCSGLAQALDKTTKTGTRVLEWQGDPQPKADALALRLAGGLHAIVRRAGSPDLQKYYDGVHNTYDAEFLHLVMALISQEDDELLSWLDNAPQTNEVARSSIIFAGLSVVAEEFQKPINLFELGSSGGLNLQVANFRYEFSGQKFGSQNSSLQLKPEWNGTLPPRTNVDVVGKRGCDLNPLSVNNERDCEKLIAYLWPDQLKRIERVQAAIEIAKQNPPLLDSADAADWVEDTFVKAECDGSVKVLFHTIAQNYFPQSVTDRIKVAMETAAQRATVENPVAWLAFEFDGEGDPKLKLKTWPDSETKVLATADPHVYSIKSKL